MLRKRIIFSLIYNNGFFTQSRNFRLQTVGNIQWLERNYQFQKISFALDELVVVNATREKKDFVEFTKMLNRLCSNVFIPICAGGGISSSEHAHTLFKNGADKVIINSALYTNPVVVRSIIQSYGSQSVVASIDYKYIEGSPRVFINNGQQILPYKLTEYLDHVNSLEVGEIYLNSIDKDGTGFGFDMDILPLVSKTLKSPLILAGGAGNENHLEEGLSHESISAVATANLFNFIGNGLPLARRKIIENGGNLANWDSLNH